MSSNQGQFVANNPYLTKAGAGAADMAKKALDKTPKIRPEYVKLTAEFFGSYMLVFAVCLNKTTGADNAGLKIFGPTGVACTLMVLIYSLGNISGGHFNPAVTFSAVVHKLMTLKEGIMYMTVQCVAGCLAGGTCILIYGLDHTKATGGLGPVSGKFFLGAPLVEFFYTFMLCFVAMNVSMAKETSGQNNFYGLAIGFVVIAGGYGGGAVSGGAFNPAITIGVNVMCLSWAVVAVPVYVAVQFAGGFLAVTALRIVRPEEKKRSDQNDDLVPAIGNLVRKIEGLFDPEDTAEFLGTLFLVLTISLNGMMEDKTGAFWSIAASLMCMIFAVGDISGGLFNPALTVAFMLRYLHTGGGVKKDGICDPMVSKKEGVKYMFVQFLGGGCGAGLNLLVYLFSEQWPATHVGAKEGFNHGQAFFAEFYGTFLLCYVVICVTTTNNPLKEYTGFCIGGCIIAAGYAFGPLSGGLLNPAVTVPMGVLYKLEFIYKPGPIVYILAQILGGVFAAIIFRFVTHRAEVEETDKMASGREVEQGADYYLVTEA